MLEKKGKSNCKRVETACSSARGLLQIMALRLALQCIALNNANINGWQTWRQSCSQRQSQAVEKAQSQFVCDAVKSMQTFLDVDVDAGCSAPTQECNTLSDFGLLSKRYTLHLRNILLLGICMYMSTGQYHTRVK